MKLAIRLLSHLLVVALLLSTAGCARFLFRTESSDNHKQIKEILNSSTEADSLAEAPITSSISSPSADSTANSSSIPTAYQDILNTLVRTFPWENTETPVLEDGSYMYFLFNDLSNIGYALLDVDGNGQKELIIGEEYTIVDMYTLKSGKAIHVFSGGERDRYHLHTDGTIINSGSSGASSSSWSLFRLNTDQLLLLDSVIFDGWTAVEMGLVSNAEDSDYYFQKSDEGDYLVIEKSIAKARIEQWETGKTAIPYIPLSTLT